MSNGWRTLGESRRGGSSRAAVALSRLSTGPFGRLAVTHALSVGADAVLALSLAGSLFFSISPDAARGKVALYLALTMAPFALVAPFLGPLLDRSAGGRRWVVIGTAAGRAVLCFMMAADPTSLLLFPLAFGALVLGKAYAIARSSYVPATVRTDAELVRANSRLALIGAIAGLIAGIPGAILTGVFDARPGLYLASLLFVGAAVAATRLKSYRDDNTVGWGSSPASPGSPASTPPRSHDRRGEHVIEVRSIDDEFVQAGMSPPPTSGDGAFGGFAGGPGATGSGGPAGLAERVLGQRPEVPANVAIAGTSMGILRGIVGFLSFAVLFALKQDHADAVWFGLMGFVSLAGSLLGNASAPVIRQKVHEERMLQALVGAVAVVALLAIQIGGKWGAAVLALAVGYAAACGRLAFDSLVQRDAHDHNRGAAFAGFETRFQMAWVVGGFVPVLVAIPLRVSFAVVAAGAGFACFAAIAGTRAPWRQQGEQLGRSG